MFQWSWWKISTTFICIHEDSNNTKDNNLGLSKSMASGAKESGFFPPGIPQSRQWEKYPNWFQHLPAETLLSLSENLEMSGAANRRCWRRDQALGNKQNRNKKKQTNWNHDIWYVHADGSITSNQAGWDFTVEQGTTNIHESSAVYKVKTSCLTIEAIIVMDTLHWITPRCSSQTSASVLSLSVKVKMENSKIACNNVWPQS